MPRLGLGAWENTDPETGAESVRTALESGYRRGDTAQGYDNEAAVGERIDRADVDREEIVLATKVDTGTLAYEDVIESTEASLRKLGVETVDLPYVHWPIDTDDPEATPPAFVELRDRGAIRHVGVSNFEPDQLDVAREVFDAPLFANQVEMHPLCPRAELLEYAREHDHWLVAYSPLARGTVFDVGEIVAVAANHDATAARVSLAWLLETEGVAAIPRSESAAHIRENLEARSLELDADDLERLDSIDRRHREVDFDGAPWNR